MYECFELDKENETYNCNEKRKNGKACEITIKSGKWNLCSNLKRHLERCHNEKWKCMKQADEEELQLKSKKKQQLSSKQPSIKSHFEINVIKSVTVSMSKQKFIRGIVKIVIFGVPLNFFESRGFLVLNGEMVRKLSVSFSHESICPYVVDAANLARDALITKLKGKLVYIKIDGATRQLRSFLGINVQYYDESESEAVVKTLTCADSEKKHSSQQMCEIFETTLQKFDVPKENVLCLVVDNASNMTKTVERLNENDMPFKDPDVMHNNAVDEEVDSDDEPVTLVNIDHMRCAVHTLQLAIKDGLIKATPMRKIAN